MRPPALHRRFPVSHDAVLKVLGALQAESRVSMDFFAVEHVEAHFAGEDRRAVRVQIVAALDVLVEAGILRWRYSPSDMVESTARNQIWNHIEADLDRLLLEHARVRLYEARGAMLYQLWLPDAEALSRGLHGTLHEAPLRRLTAEFVTDDDGHARAADAPTHLPEIDADAVYRAIEHIDYEEGATFDELVAHFGIDQPAEWRRVDLRGERHPLIGSPIDNFSGLLGKWVKANEIVHDARTGRYRTDPAPPPGNAVRLYLKLWPLRKNGEAEPIGATDAGEKVGLAKSTVHEHFKDLLEADLLEKTQGARPKHRPKGRHILVRLAGVVAKMEAEAKARGEGAAMTLGSIADRLAENRRDGSFHRLTEEARDALLHAAIANHLLQAEGWSRNRPDYSKRTQLTLNARFAILACEGCGGPILPEDIVELRSAQDGQGWKWVGIRHVECPREPASWSDTHLQGDLWAGHGRRESTKCTSCDTLLWRVSAADVLRAHPDEGHAAFVALRRLRTIVSHVAKRPHGASSAAEGRAILARLEKVGPSLTEREALLADFLAYLEGADLGAPRERAEWLFLLAAFEARHRRNATGLFHVFTVDEEDPRERFWHSVRGVREAGSACAMVDAWGFRHVSCPPRAEEEEP